MVKYFSDIFTSCCLGLEDVLQHVSPRISEGHNANITEFSEFEMKEAIFSMHSDKAPSPDGMNPGYFRAF